MPVSHSSFGNKPCYERQIEELRGSEERRSETPSISAVVLDTLIRTCQTLVPFLHIAASTALSILRQAQVCTTLFSSFQLTANCTQEATCIQDEFQGLAKDACDLVYVALVARKAHEQEGSEMLSDLNTNLANLVECGSQPISPNNL